MTTKYVARLNGEIVGKRTTANRSYTNAVIVQRVELCARNAAYAYQATDVDRSNFAFSSYVAAQFPGVTCRPEGWRQSITFDEREISKAKARIEGGFDAYVGRLRQAAIASFETAKADGKFNPFVATWCGRRDLTEKAVGQFTGASVKLVAIVDAEEVR